jgi:hypothetical protein
LVKIDRMLHFLEPTSSASCCSRRTWLRLGTFSALAAGGSSGLGSQKQSHPKLPGFGRAKSVIVVFANGGQSQIDTWDPKPDAPLDVRGAFRPISTTVPGLQFCEHMPQIAAVADRLTIVRSMSHEDLDHGSAVYLALTGVYHARRSGNPPPSPQDVPTLGAVVRRVSQRERFVCDAIHVNGPAVLPKNLAPGQDGGLLGRSFEPLVVGDASTALGAIAGLEPLVDLPPSRLRDRLALKHSLDAQLLQWERDTKTRDLAGIYGRAYDLLASPSARNAFDLAAEPAVVRDRYGRHRSGQALLLARRLAQAGVPYINVIWNHSNRGQDLTPDDTDLYGWDTHNDIFVSLKDRLLPRFDQSFSALVEDLDRLSMLDQTLVVCMGEFGRAPKVALEPRFAGASPGRKHWAGVYSIALAGAGVQRGAVVGASDRLGAEPITDRYGPWDISATIFHALGIDPAGHYTDSLGRPYAISTGKPIVAAYGTA